MAEFAGLSRIIPARWWDPALAVGLTTAALTEVVVRPATTDSWHAAAVVLALGALLLVRRRRAPEALWVAAAILVTYPHFDRHLPQSGTALIVALTYSCGAHAPRRRGLLALGGLIAATQIGMGFTDAPNLEILLPTLAPWWIGTQVRTRRALVAALAARNRELEAQEEHLATLSVRRERLRVAGELHDAVGHRLAVIVVQAQAGARAQDTSTGGEFFAAIDDAAREALVEMGQLLEVLEADGGAGSGLSRLRLLLDDAGRGALRVSSVLPAPGVTLAPAVEDAAYRIVREGVTNAIKHAPGAELVVRVVIAGAAVEVEVSDRGAAAPSGLATSGSGMGLAGMREHVEALGGELDAGRGALGGWTLNARLPLAAARA
jgi:MYXO-CTERM domain-containing protein